MEFSDAQIGAWVGSFLWPLFRIASFLMVVPVIGTQLVPGRVRIGLSAIIALMIAPMLPEMPQIEAVSFEALIVIIQQVFIGTLLGLMFVMMMQLFVVAGQMIAMQMGLGFASMVDPANGVNVPVLSQFFLIGVTLTFLAINGHLVMIEAIIESFNAWPVSANIIGVHSVGADVLWEMIMRVSWLFSSAFVIALPVIASVLIVNISFGVMSKAAPQLNVFSLGFPIGMLFGILILWVSISALGAYMINFSEATFTFVNELMRA